MRLRGGRCRIPPVHGISSCNLALELGTGNVVQAARYRGKETYVNGNEDVEPVVLRPCFALLVVLLCCVVSDDEGVLWELLEEALGSCAVDVEV